MSAESPTGVPVQRMVRRNGSQCLVCGSRKSTTRIHTDNLGYDEVACSRHIAELEHHADATLGVNNGVLRWHVTSSGGVMRGVPRVSPNVESSATGGAKGAK